MSKFKVGDIVKGIETRKYLVTNEKLTKGLVTHVEDNSMSVRVLSYNGTENGCFIGDEFPCLEMKYFELVKPLTKYIKGVSVESVGTKTVVTIEDGLVIAFPTSSIGISSVTDGEVFVQEIGESLAFYREQTGGSK